MYKPVFTQPPATWTEWWSAVRRFAAGWYDITPGEVRGYHHDADLLGQRLGIALSPSIHEWAAFAADLRQAGLFDRAIRDRFALGWNADIEAVTLLTLIEGDVCWAVRRDIAYLHAAGGGFSVSLPPSAELIERLRRIGRTSIDLDGQTLIEDDDLVIMAGRSLWTPDEDTDMTVEIEIGASRSDSIPQLLVDLACGGGGIFHGAFADLRHR